MKVLITGATGLIGSEFVQLLLNNGVEVNFLTTSKNKIVTASNFNGFYWDPIKGIIDNEAFNGVTKIFHFAGSSISQKWTTKNKKEILDSRVLSTRLLFNALHSIEHTVDQFISSSAIGIYPSSYSAIYHEDEMEVDDSFLGKVVYAWEKEVDAIAALGIRVTKVRTGLVLSSKGGILEKLVKPINYGFGALFGSGKQFQSWIHIEDLIQIFYFVMIHELEGVFNGVSPYPLTNSEMTKAIAKHLNKPLWLPNIPKFVLKFALGEMHYLLFASQNVSAKKILKQGFQFKYATIDKALKNLL